MRNKGLSNSKWRVNIAQDDWTFVSKVCIKQTNSSIVEYTEITAPIITRQLMDTPLSVGNCNSASMTVSILLPTGHVIPKAAEVEVKSYITSEGLTDSNEKTFGKFYVDKRQISHDGRLVTLSCYDAMMKANALFLPQTYTIPTGETWPKPMSVIVSEIATKLGVTADPATLQILADKENGTNGNDYAVALPNGLTMKQILEGIAACHGGNWIITEENELRLVKLVDMFSNSTDTTNVIAVLGEMDTGKTVTISSVSREREDGQTYRKPTNAGNGYEIKLGRVQYATDNMVDALYTELNGKTYYPFTATKTVVDPAVELGDRITFGNIGTFPMLTQKITFDVSPFMDISAPNSEELSEEFPYLTERELREMADKKLDANARALFQVASDSISSEVTRATGAEGELSSRISQNADNISLSVKNGEISSKLSLEQGQISIESNRISITSTNFTLTNTGSVTAKDITLTSSSSQNGNEVKVTNGDIEFYKNNNLYGRLTANYTISSKSGIILGCESTSAGIAFSVNGYVKYMLNNGWNSSFTEDILFFGTTRFHNSANFSSGISFDGGNPSNTTPGVNMADLFVSNGTLCTQAGFYTGGNLSVIGNATVSGSLTLTSLSSSANLFCQNGVLCSNNKIHSDVGFEVGGYPVITKDMVAVRSDGVLIALSNF